MRASSTAREPTKWRIRRPTEEGLRAQELLRQAEAAQQELRSATFEGAMNVSLDGMKMQMLFNGATSGDGESFAMRTNGVPGGADVEMQILVRGGRVWTNTGKGWSAGGAAPSGAQRTKGIDLGDIHAVLTIDQRTRLLDTAYISFAMSAQGKSVEIELRYRLASVNEPVELPEP